MADNLTSDQMDALKGPVINASWQYNINLITASSGTINIASRVISLGKVNCKLFNWNKKTASNIQWPRITWRVSNGDGYFSPQASGNVWGSDSPTSCSLQLLVINTDPAFLIINDTFPIQRVELLKDQGVANIYATSRAASLLAKEQSREGMRWEVDFDTNSVDRRITG